MDGVLPKLDASSGGGERLTVSSHESATTVPGFVGVGVGVGAVDFRQVDKSVAPLGRPNAPAPFTLGATRTLDPVCAI